MMHQYQGTKEQWNAFVAANSEDGGVLQSWEWGELERAEQYKVWRLAWKENGELVGCCLLVERRLQFGWKYLYAPRGPVVSRITYQVSDVVSELEKFARERGAIFLRIEPPYQQFPISNFPASPAGRQFPIRSVSPIQPRQTLRIDLTQSEDELLKAMHQKTRYNIGLAEKRGVVCSQQDFDVFWQLLEITARRDHFSLHSRQHYKLLLKYLNADLLAAHYGGKTLAIALTVSFEQTTYYLHGASANEYRDVMAPYALHWMTMCSAKTWGSTAYDLWGVDENRWPGVTRFKQGFAPNTPFTTYAGTYDLPIRKIPYALYRVRKLL